MTHYLNVNATEIDKMHELYRFRQIETFEALRRQLLNAAANTFSKRALSHLHLLNSAISDIDYAFKEKARTTGMRVNNEGSPLRLVGEPYINHAMRVALTICNTGLDINYNIVLAALAHDMADDPYFHESKFDAIKNTETARILKKIKEISENEQRFIELCDQGATPKLMPLSNNRFAQWALLIKAATRYDNLLTSSSLSPQKQYELVKNTERYLLPLTEKSGAKVFAEHIKEELFRINQKLRTLSFYPDLYADIEHKIASLNCAQTAKNTVKRIRDILLGQDSNTSYQSHKNHFRAFDLLQLKVYDVYEQMCANHITDVSLIVPSTYFHRILAVVSVSGSNGVLELFREIAENPKTSDLTVTLLDGNRLYFKDVYLNKYEVTAVSADELSDYMYGINESSVSRGEKDSITVYSENGTAVYLPEQATIIDYAFALNKTRAMYLKHATINDISANIFKTLMHNDKICLYYEFTPQIQASWLDYCVTPAARNAVIDYCDNLIRIISSIFTDRKDSVYSGKDPGAVLNKLRDTLYADISPIELFSDSHEP